MNNSTRTETDLLGSKSLDDSHYFGIQTQRATDNFQLSGKTMQSYPELIRALAYIKAACAEANFAQGLLNPQKKRAITNACNQIIEGNYDNHFVVDMIQGGAGTSSNMNMNEVIANVALEKIGHSKGEYQHLHPNSDVNMSQSTNDVYPSAVRLAILFKQKNLLNSMTAIQQSFTTKAREFDSIIKLARTQLQDAVPMTLGQEFKGFASTIKEDIKLLSNTSALLHEINLGGTAVGTGINTIQGYSQLAINHLAEATQIPFVPADDLVEASSDMGAFVIYSAVLKRFALKLSKIANDLRLLSMGPRAGLSEIMLPARQPGSSIMPGKVNPVIPEAVSQCAYQVIGNDMAITMAAEAGQLQLNAMEPLIAVNIFNSIELLTNACDMFNKLCVQGIEANQTRCRDLLDGSLGLITALNPHLGYEASSSIAKEALATGIPVITLIKAKNLLTNEQLHEILQPNKMTQPAL